MPLAWALFLLPKALFFAAQKPLLAWPLFLAAGAPVELPRTKLFKHNVCAASRARALLFFIHPVAVIAVNQRLLVGAAGQPVNRNHLPDADPDIEQFRPVIP